MPFSNSVKPSDRRNLEDEFEPYMAGFFFWVLGMSDEEMRNYLINTDEVVPSLQQHSMENLTETNPVAEWIQAKVLIKQGTKTYIGTKTKDAAHYLYPNYCEWVIENGSTPLSLNKFSRVMLDVLITQLRISNSIRDRDKYGVFITDVILRQPGDLDIPFSFGAVDSSNLNSNLSDKVTAGEGSVKAGEGSGDGFLNPVSQSQSISQVKVKAGEGSEPCQPPEKNSESHRLTDYSDKPLEEVKSHHQVVTTAKSSSQLEVQAVITSLHQPSPSLHQPSPVTIYKENMTVYPLNDDYEGKECKVGTVDERGIWVRPVTTQIGVQPICYQPSNLSFDAPVFEEEVSKYTQQNIFDLVPGEDCLEDIDD